MTEHRMSYDLRFTVLYILFAVQIQNKIIIPSIERLGLLLKSRVIFFREMESIVPS